MTMGHEQGTDAYMAFRLAHAMFQRDPADLTTEEQAQLAKSVRHQVSIESCVLASVEAKDVLVPEATVEEALAQLRSRYATADEFAAALDAQGFDEADLRRALRRELRVEAVLDKVSSRAARVSELDVQLHYQLRREQFERPERRRVAHILITINDDFAENSRDRALARIGAIRARLLKDPRRFAEQAMKHSECPSAMNGGVLGECAPGQLFPQIDAALFSLREGELSPVVESELGFHVVCCEKILAAGVVPYREAEPKIRAAIEARRRRVCQRSWISALMQQQAGTAETAR